MAEYAHPEVLVSTDWVAEHRTDPNVRIVESDEDILLYDVGHIPGAIKVDWQSELQHQVIRVCRQGRLCQACGEQRHRQQPHCGLLWRPEQLVGMLCPLGV
jgi:3-mercaptopyruvate sulfurtransferase SseA